MLQEMTKDLLKTRNVLTERNLSLYKEMKTYGNGKNRSKYMKCFSIHLSIFKG